MKSSSLYIHIPFCARKCLFCSFAIAIAQEQRAHEYVSALIKEMKIYEGRRLSTVYLGGGTPSMLPDDEMARLMQGLRAHCIIDADAEISIEANPEGMNEVKAHNLRSFGFNRISLGVQSLDDRYLKFLGRAHDSHQAISAYQVLRGEGFNNINLDLMYAFPNQTPQELQADVRAITSLGSAHVSLYTLTIEPNSRFFAKQMKLDEEGKLADHFMLVSRLLDEYGFKQYEVSNFAKTGFESRHNINYWQGGEYIALGMGAHGYLNNRRYWNVGKLQEYLLRINKEESPIEGYEDLSEATRLMEKVIFGLRMNRGISFGLVPQDKRKIIDTFIADGFLTLNNDTLQATPQGRLVLDEISARLI